jgi:antitoxin component YwqK of YwqJK toxin-antitoxin module
MKKIIFLVIFITGINLIYAQKLIKACDSTIIIKTKKLYYSLKNKAIDGQYEIVDCTDSSLIIQEILYSSGEPIIVKSFWANGMLKEYIDLKKNDYLSFFANGHPNTINQQTNFIKLYLRIDSLHIGEYSIYFDFDSSSYVTKFNQSGNIQYFQFWKRGLLKTSSYFNEDGNLIKKEYSINDSVIFEEDFEAGKKKSEGELLFGTIENERGELIDGYFKNGIWKLFDEKGMIFKKQKFKLGKEVDL